MPYGSSPIKDIISKKVEIVKEKSDLPPPPDEFNIDIW